MTGGNGAGLVTPLQGLVGPGGQPLDARARAEAEAMQRAQLDRTERNLTDEQRAQLEQINQAQQQHIEMYAMAYLRYAPASLPPEKAMLIQQQNRLTGELRWYFTARDVPPIPREVLNGLMEIAEDAARNGGRSKAAQMARELVPELRAQVRHLDLLREQAEAENAQREQEARDAQRAQETPSGPESNAFGLRVQSVDDDEETPQEGVQRASTQDDAARQDAMSEAYGDTANIPDQRPVELLTNQERQERRHASGDRWV